MTVKLSRNRMRTIGAVLLALSASGCGEYLREQGRSPSQVVVLSLVGARGHDPEGLGSPLMSDVLTIVTKPAPCSPESPCPTVFNDLGSVSMQLVLKDQSQPASAASPLNQVTFTRYRVQYRRSDGRNVPGVDVPYDIDGALTFTVGTGDAVTAGFELVRHTAKNEAPLRALRTAATTINTVSEVIFYGRDLAGNDVQATASMQINFGNFGD
jgi:hypothetical protein